MAEPLSRRVGVLLINLGSPDQPTPSAIRRYLNQFLSDRRVVEIPPFVWQIILKLFVLPFRPRKTAKLYAQIWGKGKNDNPLRAITRRQTQVLEKMLPNAEVRFAMRYGVPSIEDGLQELQEAGVSRVLLAPLYPQYCSATTGTALEEAFRVFAKWRVVPAVRTMPDYHDDPAYIEALATSVRQTLAGLSFEPEHILLSFHGIPKRAVELGDPYGAQCKRTADLLRAALGRDAGEISVAFQSRFGRAEWLQPYTMETLSSLAKRGVKKVLVISPAFAADCLETLSELEIEAREIFLDAGGEQFALVPCLNDSPHGMEMLHALVARSLAGWGVVA